MEITRSSGLVSINDLKIDDPTAVTGYVWTATDADGNGSWQAAAGGSDGDGIYDGDGTTPADSLIVTGKLTLKSV